MSDDNKEGAGVPVMILRIKSFPDGTRVMDRVKSEWNHLPDGDHALYAHPAAVMPAAPSDAVPNGWRIIKTDEGFLVSAPLGGPGGLTVTPTDKALSARVLHALCFALSQTMQPQAEPTCKVCRDVGSTGEPPKPCDFCKIASIGKKFRELTDAQAEPSAGEQAGAVASEGRCLNCDDTGDVNSITGEWRGVCHCPAGQAINARALAAPGAAIAAREEEAKVPKAGSFLMQRIDAAADALSEVLAFQRLNDDRKTKVARALSGLRGLQSIATPSAALTQPTTVQQAGHCERPEGCVCGGDLPLIRERCGNWVKGGA